MPTYYARGVSAHLAAMPLDDAITPRIILRKGDAAKEEAETVEGKILGSRRLKEELVPFPGDDECLQLSWLGNAPFMQARATFEEEGVRDTSEAGARIAEARQLSGLKIKDFATADNKPQALVLHVELSNRTFVSGLYGEKTSLKIDVLLNGQLTTSWFMPTHDMRSGVKGHHQVFAGTRVDFLAERPWVILPSELTADGKVRKISTKTASVEQRWAQICWALQDEARERGTNEEGVIPPTADFLSALAAMQMPEQVREMQEAGGKVFGTVDVVITAGEGRKLTSGIGYLKAPRRLADENYPLILKGDSVTTHARAVEAGRSDDGLELQTPLEVIPEAIDVDAEGDSDPDYEHQPKRQATESRVLFMQNDASVAVPNLPHPILGPAIPSIPPPLQTNIGGSPRSAASGSDEASQSPVARTANSTNISHSPERSPVHTQAHSSRVSPKDRSLNLPPHLHTPQMLPAPYTLHLSDPAPGGTAPSDLLRQVPMPGAVHTSSPLDRFHASFHSPAFDQSFSLTNQMTRRLQGPFASSPYTAPFPIPNQACRGSFDAYFPPSNYQPSGMGPPFPVPYSFSAAVPNMLPPVPIPLGHHGTRPPLVSYPPYPYDRRLSGPLPPAALYTVPTKPRRSVSAQKDPGSRCSSTAQSSILVSRLVISGLEGEAIVNHRWTPAKRIDLASSRTYIEQSPSGSLVEKVSFPSETDAELPTGLRRSKRNTVIMDNAPPTLARQLNDPLLYEPADKRERDDARATQAIREPHAFTRNGNVSAPSPEWSVPIKSNQVTTRAAQPGNPVTVPITVTLRAIQPMPQRRNASGSSILGVHGPKANPYLFDDPEELLRQASARRRRPRSPSRETIPAVAPQRQVSQYANYSVEYSKAADSSPLSSLHTTPEPEEPDIMLAPPTPTTWNDKQSPVAPIPHLDGSPESKPAPRSFRTPSLTKLASATTPRLPTNINTTPLFSPRKRKAKTQNRTLVKEPRSPNRLQTISNPPLNEDCVLAYAESKDKADEQGVLRQVKGERAGVFMEEYVVFACRFFVGE